MKRLVSLTYGLVIAGLLAFSTGAAAQQQTFVTGPLGGSWYPIGSSMIEIIEKNVGVVYTQQPGGGVSNSFAVGSGKAQFGISTGHVAASAVAGKADFEGKAQTNLRLVGKLYPQQYTMVTWADGPINSVADVKGKALETTRRGSSTELMTRRVLEAYGITYDDLASINHSNVSDGVNQMKDGQVVGMSHLITNPASHAMELQSVKPIRIVPLTEGAIKTLVESYPGYKPTVIPANTYEGQSADIPTIGDGAVLITAAEVDDDLVYRATKALFENNAQLAATRAVMKNFTPEKASENPPIEIHPGALRYYREIGVAK